MQWFMPGLAGIAERAGWATAELPEAVAVAWATSQGDDTALTPTGPPRRLLVGLWGVPALPGTSAAVLGALSGPEANARAARSLWVHDGGTWGWLPLWASSPAGYLLDLAAEVVATGSRADTAGGAGPGPGGDRPPLRHLDGIVPLIGDLFDAASALRRTR